MHLFYQNYHLQVHWKYISIGLIGNASTRSKYSRFLYGLKRHLSIVFPTSSETLEQCCQFIIFMVKFSIFSRTQAKKSISNIAYFIALFLISQQFVHLCATAEVRFNANSLKKFTPNTSLMVCTEYSHQRSNYHLASFKRPFRTNIACPDPSNLRKIVGPQSQICIFHYISSFG